MLVRVGTTPAAAAGHQAGAAPLAAAAAAPLRRTLRAARGPPAPRAVTDQSVPEGHKALHSTLYDKEAADVHAESRGYRPVAGEDDGDAVLAVDGYVAAREGAKPPGVFAIYNAAKELQYVGFR
jgi:hypothetical protein